MLFAYLASLSLLVYGGAIEEECSAVAPAMLQKKKVMALEAASPNLDLPELPDLGQKLSKGPLFEQCKARTGYEVCARSVTCAYLFQIASKPAGRCRRNRKQPAASRTLP